MQLAIPILFYALAVIIHGVPALSVFAPSKIASLYGISAQDSTVLTLLHHRAVLFVLISAACIYAAHTPSVRWPVLIGTAISMISFMAIAVMNNQISGPLRKVVYVDGAGILIAAVLAVLLLRLK